MPRQGRLDAPGTLHHVMIRGIDGLEIFRDDQDREDCPSRIPQLVGSIGQNIRLIPYGNYVHVHKKYLHLGHYLDHTKARNREAKVTVFNNFPQAIGTVHSINQLLRDRRSAGNGGLPSKFRESPE